MSQGLHYGGLVLALLISTSVALAQEPKAPQKLILAPEAQQDVMVTIYNNNYGLVREVRNVTLPEGILELEFQGVAEKIDPTSVAFDSISSPGKIAILEQDYRYDLLSPASLINKYVGKEIILRRDVRKGDSDQSETRQGTLLSTNEGTVIKFGDTIEINPPGNVILPSAPKELLSKPTLVWLLENKEPKEQKVEASYLTNDMNWHADYVAKVNPDDTKIDLTGWVTLDNKSGATYHNAQLKLVAGDVQRVQDAQLPLQRPMMAKAAAMDSAERGFAEKSFFEYHLYTLGRRTTISQNETKQMTLLEGQNVPIKKTYVLQAPAMQFRGPEWNDKRKLAVVLELDNKKENNLGMALPAGRVRVYKADTDGSLQLLGEDSIDHTPRDEKVRLKIGEAFDIRAEASQSDFKQISRRVSELSYRVVIRNHKDSDISATVIEKLWGDWTVTVESLPHVKKDATTIEFSVPVKANGEATLTYTARIEI